MIKDFIIKILCLFEVYCVDSTHSVVLDQSCLLKFGFEQNTDEIQISLYELETIEANAFEPYKETLKELHLKQNSLIKLVPRQFSILSGLKIFEIEENPIRHLQKQIFIGLISLEDLSLKRNALISIEARAFEDLKICRI